MNLFPKHIGLTAISFATIATLIYLLMINVTLAHIETLSGHAPFDMRPFGYSPADAAALLDALGAEGRAYYLSHQIPLDTLYPASLALTLICTILWFGQSMSHRAHLAAGILLSLGAALFDYAENLTIIALIWNWPDTPTLLVNAASAATLLKSALTTLAVLQTLLIAILWTRSPRTKRPA